MSTPLKIVFNPFTSTFDYIQSADDGLVLSNIPCEAAAMVADVVRMSGGIAVRALADTSLNGNAIGIIENKCTPTTADIRVLGKSGSIFTGLTENIDYYLSDIIPGALTTTVPTASGSVVLRIGQAFSATELIVLKGLRLVRA